MRDIYQAIRRKWYGLLVLVCALALLVPSPAYAAPPAQSNTGAVVCQGNGTGYLSLNGSLAIDSLSTGAARIMDADDIQATGEGKRVDGANWTLFAKWTGEITASDADFNARISGANISFTVAGSGTLLVHGQGACTAQSGEVFSWVGNAGPIAIEPLP